jgi:hypothetical protein
MVFWFHHKPSWRPKVWPCRESVPSHILTGCIRRLKEGMQLAVKEWRVRFSVENREVRVVGIVSGQRHRSWQAATLMTCARPTGNAAAGGGD